MAQLPMPTPPLDGVPPSPSDLQAGGGQNPPLSQLSAGQQLGGSMQMIAVFMQAGQQVASLLDMMGQANPAFAPVSQMLIEQLRGGLKSTLQQGMNGNPEPSAPQQQPPQGPGQLAGMPPQGGAPPQQPLPSLPAGM